MNDFDRFSQVKLTRFQVRLMYH